MGCALALILFYLYRDFYEEGSLRTILTFLSSLGLSAICVGLDSFYTIGGGYFQEAGKYWLI